MYLCRKCHRALVSQPTFPMCSVFMCPSGLTVILCFGVVAMVPSVSICMHTEAEL